MSGGSLRSRVRRLEVDQEQVVVVNVFPVPIFPWQEDANREAESKISAARAAGRRCIVVENVYEEPARPAWIGGGS